MAEQPKTFYTSAPITTTTSVNSWMTPNTEKKDTMCHPLELLRDDRRRAVSHSLENFKWEKTALPLLKKSCFHLDVRICRSPEKRIWNQTEEKLCTVSPKIQCVHKASTEKTHRSEATTYNWLLSCHSLNNTGHGWRESRPKASRNTSS